MCLFKKKQASVDCKYAIYSTDRQVKCAIDGSLRNKETCEKKCKNRKTTFVKEKKL